MTLYDYINEQKVGLEQFKDHWERGIRENPLDFPSTLDVGDWDDQYLIFRGFVSVVES